MKQLPGFEWDRKGKRAVLAVAAWKAFRADLASG